MDTPYSSIICIVQYLYSALAERQFVLFSEDQEYYGITLISHFPKSREVNQHLLAWEDKN